MMEIEINPPHFFIINVFQFYFIFLFYYFFNLFIKENSRKTKERRESVVSAEGSGCKVRFKKKEFYIILQQALQVT